MSSGRAGADASGPLQLSPSPRSVAAAHCGYPTPGTPPRQPCPAPLLFADLTNPLRRTLVARVPRALARVVHMLVATCSTHPSTVQTHLAPSRPSSPLHPIPFTATPHAATPAMCHTHTHTRSSATSPFQLVSTYPPPADHVRTLHDNLEYAASKFPHVREEQGQGQGGTASEQSGRRGQRRERAERAGKGEGRGTREGYVWAVGEGNNSRRAVECNGARAQLQAGGGSVTAWSCARRRLGGGGWAVGGTWSQGLGRRRLGSSASVAGAGAAGLAGLCVCVCGNQRTAQHRLLPPRLPAQRLQHGSTTAVRRRPAPSRSMPPAADHPPSPPLSPPAPHCPYPPPVRPRHTHAHAPAVQMPYLGWRKRDDKGRLGAYTWMTYAQVCVSVCVWGGGGAGQAEQGRGRVGAG